MSTSNVHGPTAGRGPWKTIESANQAKGNDLEQFINRRNPKTHEELEALNRYYLYHYTRL
jgi:hypothetical protein